MYKIVQQFLRWLYIEMLIFWLTGHIGLTKISVLFRLFSPAYFLNVAAGKFKFLQQRKQYTKWKSNLKNGRKYLQTIYPIRG